MVIIITTTQTQFLVNSGKYITKNIYKDIYKNIYKIFQNKEQWNERKYLYVTELWWHGKLGPHYYVLTEVYLPDNLDTKYDTVQTPYYFILIQKMEFISHTLKVKGAVRKYLVLFKQNFPFLYCTCCHF